MTDLASFDTEAVTHAAWSVQCLVPRHLSYRFLTTVEGESGKEGESDSVGGGGKWW